MEDLFNFEIQLPSPSYSEPDEIEDEEPYTNSNEKRRKRKAREDSSNFKIELPPPSYSEPDEIENKELQPPYTNSNEKRKKRKAKKELDNPRPIKYRKKYKYARKEVKNIFEAVHDGKNCLLGLFTDDDSTEKIKNKVTIFKSLKRLGEIFGIDSAETVIEEMENSIGSTF